MLPPAAKARRPRSALLGGSGNAMATTATTTTTTTTARRLEKGTSFKSNHSTGTTMTATKTNVAVAIPIPVPAQATAGGRGHFIRSATMRSASATATAATTAAATAWPPDPLRPGPLALPLALKAAAFAADAAASTSASSSAPFASDGAAVLTAGLRLLAGCRSSEDPSLPCRPRPRSAASAPRGRRKMQQQQQKQQQQLQQMQQRMSLPNTAPSGLGRDSLLQSSKARPWIESSQPLDAGSSVAAAQRGRSPSLPCRPASRSASRSPSRSSSPSSPQRGGRELERHYDYEDKGEEAEIVAAGANWLGQPTQSVDLSNLSPGPPPLLAGSSICERANERLGGLEQQLESWELAQLRSSKTEGLVEDREQRDARFQNLMEVVENQVQRHMDGEAAPVRLRLGDVVDLSLNPQGLRYFTIQLPARVVDISVNVFPAAGTAMPYMYASLQPNVRPTRQDHEMEGDAGEITFRHEPDGVAPPIPSHYHSSRATMTGTLTHTPTFLTLLVCTGADPVVAKFRCIARRPDEEVQSNRVGSVRRRLEEKLTHLRQDPAELLQRLEVAKATQRKARSQGQDYNRMHRRDMIANRLPRRGNKERRLERQLAAEQRREVLDMAHLARAEWWTNKEEAWRLESERAGEEHIEVVVRPGDWLVRLIAVSAIESLRVRALEEKAYNIELKSKLRSSRVIQEWSFRRGVWKSSRMHRDFVTEEQVIRIQRHVRRFLWKREARVQALLKYFNASFALSILPPEIGGTVMARAAEVQAHQSQSPSHSRPQSPTRKGNKPKAKVVIDKAEDSSPVLGEGATRRLQKKTSFVGEAKLHSQHPGAPSFVTALHRHLMQGETLEEDLMPTWLRRLVLRDHVAQMTSSYPDRMKAYMALKQENDLDIEARRWCGIGSDSSAAGQLMQTGKPRVVEVWRMPLLYAQTYEDYANTKRFHVVIHNFKRQVRKVMRAWHRLARGFGVQYASRPTNRNLVQAALHPGVAGNSIGTSLHVARRIDTELTEGLPAVRGDEEEGIDLVLENFPGL